MKHRIEPIINQHFSCHQALLATYASYKNRKYEMIFAESWGFKYQKNDQPFGISIVPNYQNRREILLKKFYGIQIKEISYTKKRDLMQLLELTLPHEPAILHCDIFNCPWSISYQRNHIDHFLLITGLVKNKNQLYVLDPYSTKDENIIDIDNVAPDDGYINSFATSQIDNIEVKDFKLEIDNSLKHIDNSEFFQSLENFYNDFIIRFEEVFSSEYTDVYTIPLIINLRRIADQRYCYCIFLNKMVHENIIDSSIKSFMEYIAEKYSLLRMLLIRQIMKKKNNKECNDILKDIINHEYEIYEKLKLCV